MSEQKDKCPECGGKGFLADGNEGITINKGYCSTCNSTGEKKLDSPREKIARKFWVKWEKYCGRSWDSLDDDLQTEWLAWVDVEIIALIEPLIKDAREQEREKILKLLPLVPEEFTHNRTCFNCVENIKEQALKEE